MHDPFIKPHVITDADMGEVTLDGYARRGVVIDRDSSHRIIAALKRDAYELRERGGEPNNEEADLLDLIATRIGRSITLA